MEGFCVLVPGCDPLKRRAAVMGIFKLKPSCKDYIWGGHRLADEYGIEYDGEILAESWELSCHPDGPSVIENGIYQGKTLEEYIEAEGRQVLGTHCRRFKDFPVLIKFIDAKQNLSIQVHPNNQYALKNEGQYGKTEMWYIMDAGEDAFLYYGFNREVTKEEFQRRIEENTLLEVLNMVPVHKGDVLFIESGTIHAIGKDILIAEIQQNSNVTYRVYDYGRVGKDGKKRDLHIEKALAVTNRVPIMKSNESYPHIADCDYFTVDKLNLDGCMMKRMEGNVTEDSFLSILMLDGEGVITCGGESISYKKGDSLFLSAGSGSYQIEGSCDALLTSMRAKAAPVRIGIDIGGTDTKIGLVDANQQLIDSVVIPTLKCREEEQTNPEQVIGRIGREVLELLEKNRIPMDQCIGAGVGVPGTVDRARGEVLYSNNIKWEKVAFVKELSRYLPLPIQIANDADCAVLGEAAAGAAKEYEDVVMLTLGTGVGGGILLGGRIFEGRKTGGSELGHMVIVENGEPCTCGRRGCLETYVSASALKRRAVKSFERELEPEEIFELAEKGNQDACEIVDEFIEKLGTGVVNIVNIFHPQVLLIGGGLSKQGERLLAPLRRTVKESSFGGAYAQIPEIETAKLGNTAGMIGAANLV